MQFGAQLSNYGTNWADIKPTVESLEDGRWNSVWFSDHFMPPGNPNAANGAALEGWTLLTAVSDNATPTARCFGYRQYLPKSSAIGQDVLVC